MSRRGPKRPELPRVPEDVMAQIRRMQDGGAGPLPPMLGPAPNGPRELLLFQVGGKALRLAEVDGKRELQERYSEGDVWTSYWLGGPDEFEFDHEAVALAVFDAHKEAVRTLAVIAGADPMRRVGWIQARVRAVLRGVLRDRRF